MPRITLHRVRRLDAAELVQAHLASRQHHEPWVRPFTSLDGFEDWFAAQVTGANLSFVARDTVSRRIAAVTNLSQIVLKDFRSAYLGYWVVADFAGQGFMTEAVRLTTIEAFTGLGLHRLEANIQPANLRSIAVARRAGFRREGLSPRYLRIDGIWCDHERWARLADDITS